MLLLLLSLPLPLLYFWLPSLKWFRKEQLTLGVVDQRSCLTMAILNASGKVTSPENMFSSSFQPLCAWTTQQKKHFWQNHWRRHRVTSSKNWVKHNLLRTNISSEKPMLKMISFSKGGIYGYVIVLWRMTSNCWNFKNLKQHQSPTNSPPPHLVPHFCGSASNRCLAVVGKELHPHHARMPS